MKIRSFYRFFFFSDLPLRECISKNIGNLVLILLSFQPHPAHAQQGIEEIGQLRLSIAAFLKDEYQHLHAQKIDLKVGAVDSRLTLAKCDQALRFTLQDPSNNGGNVNVKVACEGAVHWSILAPAQAIIYRSMAVASRNLERGNVINAGDITEQIVNVSQYRQGYSGESEEIIGKVLKYPVNKGDAFRSSVLDSPLLIKRGDQVSVEANAGSITVISAATAISDGKLGQQIRVKNNQSARILTAKVIAAGKVESTL
jgi:flagellar basal body P-ring formation protein FlgA